MLSLKEKPIEKSVEPEPKWLKVTFTAELWDGTKRSWWQEMPEKMARRPTGPGDWFQSAKCATYGFSGNGFFLTPHSIKEITWKVQ